MSDSKTVAKNSDVVIIKRYFDLGGKDAIKQIKPLSPEERVEMANMIRNLSLKERGFPIEGLDN